MNKIISAFICGLLFAVGLTVSGMTMPSKIIGFLNLTGDWDPSLLFVLGGASGTYLLIYQLIIKKKERPLFSNIFHLPSLQNIDRKLIIGAILFGAGWGLAGVCPGPAITSLTAGSSYILIFTVFMIIGMLAANLAFKRKT